MNDKKPNIIVILADDIGIGDLTCYNRSSKIPTPNMDQAASEGMIFSDAHSPSAVCSPSRYSILTGRYCWRGTLKREVLYGYEPFLIEEGRETMASALKRGGYRTACIGKWHIGIDFNVKDGESIDFDRPLPWGDKNIREDEVKIDFMKGIRRGPTDVGFDYFFGTSGCPTSQPPYVFIEGKSFTEQPTVYDDQPHIYGRKGQMAPSWDHQKVDLVFTDKATAFIKEQKDSDNPFFLYLASSACHEPCVEETVPEFARGKSKAGHRGDLVWLFDWMVGQVMKTLKETGQEDNTLIMITSDNGALPGDRFPDYAGDVGNFNTYGHLANGHYKGYKSHIWEGGHREPLIIRWPGVIETNIKSDQLFCLTDLMSTCCSIADVELKDDAGEDSFDMGPLLMGEAFTDCRKDVIHHSANGVFSIRRGKWKLIVGSLGSGGWPPPSDSAGPIPGSKGQLYNIEDDPEERMNLYEVKMDVVKELEDLLVGYISKGYSNRRCANER